MTTSAGAANASNRTVGIIGLGLVGSALSYRLRSAGFSVVGYDLDPARNAALAREGGTTANGPGEVFGQASRVMLSLPTHHEVDAVIATAGDALRSGTIVIDTTTGEPAATEACARRLAERGVLYLDATISGSSAQVRSGNATWLVGGDSRSVAACRDLFACAGGQVFHTGAAGTGARMKLVTNLVLGLNRAALAEGLALARALQLDPDTTLAALRGSMAYSKIMDTKGERMLRGNFAPEARLAQHLKDVRLIVEAGRAAGLPMPLSVAHRAILERAVAAGLGDLDNSAVIRVLEGDDAEAERKASP